MTKTEIAAAFYTVLTACINGKKTHLKGYPNGQLYAQLINEFDIGQWTMIISCMKDNGLITETNHLLQSTEKGEKMWAELDEIYRSAEQKGLE